MCYVKSPTASTKQGSDFLPSERRITYLASHYYNINMSFCCLFLPFQRVMFFFSSIALVFSLFSTHPQDSAYGTDGIVDVHVAKVNISHLLMEKVRSILIKRYIKQIRIGEF